MLMLKIPVRRKEGRIESSKPYSMSRTVEASAKSVRKAITRTFADRSHAQGWGSRVNWEREGSNGRTSYPILFDRRGWVRGRANVEIALTPSPRTSFLRRLGLFQATEVSLSVSLSDCDSISGADLSGPTDLYPLFWRTMEHLLIDIKANTSLGLLR